MDGFDPERNSRDVYFPDKESGPHENQVQKRYQNTVFNNQEENRSHNSYEEEQREMQSIETGDVEMLESCWASVQPQSYGTFSKNRIRNVKDLCIALIALASRASIRGGTTPEIAFTMCDSYVQQIEESTTAEIIVQLAHRAELRFAELAGESGNKNAGQSRIPGSPCVEKCKTYIFSHLHEKLTVKSIADTMRMNPNYLSELFRKSEGVTILQYILQEKIHLAENMLVYSDYTYGEIATYLGFSSQSHLCRHFKKNVRMTPGEYRKRYKSADFSSRP
ncbi:MAG: AraC family transcriptional regulator [Lachnospiraceae bacterium]|jgi:AraC-like DNA-binding protein|nr:AraC family transcriptional regulator [Lachnospiraceae bacterium]